VWQGYLNMPVAPSEQGPVQQLSLSSPSAAGHPVVIRYGVAVAATTAALLLSLLLRPVVMPNPFLFFVGAIAVAAWFGGLGPGFLATAIAVVEVNYFFFSPLGSFVLGPLDAIRLAAFSVVAVMISSLSEGRRRALELAQAQGKQFEVTLASIGDAVIATDTAGRVTFLNAIAGELTGWSPEAARGEPVDAVFRIVNAGSRLPVEAPLVRVLREGVIVGLANHTVLIARDGTERPIDDSGAPIRDARGRIVGAVLVFRDISEREAAEAARAELLAREQAARADAEGGRERAAFLAEASRILADSLDYPTTLRQVTDLAVPRLADWCVVDLLDDAGVIEMVAAAHVDPAKVAWAFQLRRDYPLDPEGPAGAPYVTRTGEPQLFADIPDSLLEALSRTPEELAILRGIGYSSVMVVPLRARGRVLGALSLVAAGSTRRYGADDLAFAQELAGRAAVAIDNARLYRDAQAARETAEEAIRLRDLFLSVASHELKTPLTSLLLQTQLLERRVARGGLLPEREQRTIRVVADQAQRLDRLIAALLDISRLELGQLSLSVAPVDLCALARRVVTEIQPTSDAHPITCAIAESPLLVAGDELRLEQVLQNLVQNAVKYSPAGGPVEVEVAARDGRVCLAVADRGIGLPEDALPRLFERFYRAPNADPRQISGMGIGLYVVREIVRLHGGQVQAARREGAGSRFTVCLPQLAPPAEAPAPLADESLTG
jgi:PAS domain S-box-containing protein